MHAVSSILGSCHLSKCEMPQHQNVRNFHLVRVSIKVLTQRLVPTLYLTAWFVYPSLAWLCSASIVTHAEFSTQNLFTDVLILILPIPTIATLRMSRQKRIAVLVVLTTGGAAVLTGGLRAIILFEFAESPDFTWALGKMIIISSAELSVGIIAANMPALKAFWTCWRQNKLGAGQGVGISQSEGKSGKGSSGNPHGVELSHGVNSTRSWSELGRPIRLPSTESEEALWEDQRAKGKNKIHIIASQATQSDKL